MANKTSKTLMIELKKLRDNGDENIYRRVGVAAALFGSDDWWAEAGVNDEFKAYDKIESDYFAVLGGAFPLIQLVKVFNRWPEESVWKENKYNLRVLCDMLELGTQLQEGEPQTRTKWKAKAAKLESELGDANYSLNREKETVKSKDVRIAEMQKKIDNLGREIVRLETIIEMQDRSQHRGSSLFATHRV